MAHVGEIVGDAARAITMTMLPKDGKHQRQQVLVTQSARGWLNVAECERS